MVTPLLSRPEQEGSLFSQNSFSLVSGAECQLHDFAFKWHNFCLLSDQGGGEHYIIEGISIYVPAVIPAGVENQNRRIRRECDHVVTSLIDNFVFVFQLTY